MECFVTNWKSLVKKDDRHNFIMTQTNLTPIAAQPQQNHTFPNIGQNNLLYLSMITDKNTTCFYTGWRWLK